MPYSAEHKQQTRERIVESARILFNRHGFADVTIDSIMAEAGLTRGGFYTHFKNKEQLFSEAVARFLLGRGAQWRDEFGVTTAESGYDMAKQMIDGYLSPDHLGDLDGQCPMIALPSDVAREKPAVRKSYEQLFTAMVSLFENNLDDGKSDKRQQALSVAALCVGGMVLARSLASESLANEVRVAARQMANQLAALE